MTTRDLAHQVVSRLGARGFSLGSCESMTGGGIAAMITTVPGASAVFRGALVTYASDLKVSLAGVDAEWVAGHGVINEETARQMARGAAAKLGSDLAVSVTGLAGPEGAEGVKVGTAWFGLYIRHGCPDTITVKKVFPGDRDAVRARAVEAALVLIRDGLDSGAI